jgi:hypothetical protein
MSINIGSGLLFKGMAIIFKYLLQIRISTIRIKPKKIDTYRKIFLGRLEILPDDSSIRKIIDRKRMNKLTQFIVMIFL